MREQQRAELTERVAILLDEGAATYYELEAAVEAAINTQPKENAS